MNDFDPYDWLIKLAKHQEEISKQLIEVRNDMAIHHLQLLKNHEQIQDLEQRLTAAEALLVNHLK